MSNQVTSQSQESTSITIIDGMVSSVQVAEKFGKDHKNVLRDIKDLLSSLDAEKDVLKTEPIFIESTYPDLYSRPQPQYLMTRDGFTLLAMGFNGDEALVWKVKFIQAFNAMEAKLKEIAANPFSVLDGMNSDQIAVLLAEVKAKEAAQRDVQLAQAQLAIESAEKDRALAQAAINLTAALDSAAEVALITAKDALWFSWTHGLKMLGLKPKIALAHMREKGYLNLNNTASSRLLGAAVEVCRLVTVTPEKGPARTQPKTCAAGMLWVAKHIKFPEECKERYCRLDWSEETLTAFFHDTLANTNDEEV